VAPTGHANRSGGADLHDPRAVHDQRRVLDRRAPVADDNPRAFEHSDLRPRRNRQCRKNTKGNSCRSSGGIESAHGSLLDWYLNRKIKQTFF
jgi:hypothetical protein